MASQTSKRAHAINELEGQWGIHCALRRTRGRRRNISPASIDWKSQGTYLAPPWLINPLVLSYDTGITPPVKLKDARLWTLEIRFVRRS